MVHAKVAISVRTLLYPLRTPPLHTTDGISQKPPVGLGVPASRDLNPPYLWYLLRITTWQLVVLLWFSRCDTCGTSLAHFPTTNPHKLVTWDLVARYDQPLSLNFPGTFCTLDTSPGPSCATDDAVRRTLAVLMFLSRSDHRHGPTFYGLHSTVHWTHGDIVDMHRVLRFALASHSNA